MKKGFIKHHQNGAGFTLIELLVVIAVLAVLAAGVFVAIDPVDKINTANDAKVQSDIGQIGQAMEAFITASTTGLYPANVAALVPGELKVEPKQPVTGDVYTTGTGGANQSACGVLRSKKYKDPPVSKPFWAWCSTSGKAGPVAACGNCPI